MLFPGSHCLLVMMLMFLTSMYQAGSYLVAPTQSLKKAKRHKNTACLRGCGKNTSPYQNYARYILHRGTVHHITVKELKSMPFCKLIPLLLSSSPGWQVDATSLRWRNSSKLDPHSGPRGRAYDMGRQDVGQMRALGGATRAEWGIAFVF